MSVVVGVMVVRLMARTSGMSQVEKWRAFPVWARRSGKRGSGVWRSLWESSRWGVGSRPSILVGL